MNKWDKAIASTLLLLVANVAYSSTIDTLETTHFLAQSPTSMSEELLNRQPDFTLANRQGNGRSYVAGRDLQRRLVSITTQKGTRLEFRYADSSSKTPTSFRIFPGEWVAAGDVKSMVSTIGERNPHLKYLSPDEEEEIWNAEQDFEFEMDWGFDDYITDPEPRTPAQCREVCSTIGDTFIILCGVFYAVPPAVIACGLYALAAREVCKIECGP